MDRLIDLLTGLIAVQHLGFMILEMFFWRKPLGLKTFKMTQTVADSSAKLAANQGLYNGFLSAALIWGLLATDSTLQIFGLLCVSAAGIFGGATVNRKIIFIQALPALLALLLHALT